MSWRNLISKNLKELRFILCQTNERSSGVRNYVHKNYLALKEQNETFPFLVRECEGADPYIIARYQFGVEKKAFIGNLKENEVEDVLRKLVEQADSVNKQVQK